MRRNLLGTAAISVGSVGCDDLGPKSAVKTRTLVSEDAPVCLAHR